MRIDELEPWYETERQTPVEFRKIPGVTGGYFADFGKDAFSALELTPESENGGEEIEILIGEMYDPFYERIDRKPLRNCTFRKMRLTLGKGRNVCRPEIPSGTGFLKSPIGVEIAPFRYCEITGCPKELKPGDVVRIAVFGKVSGNAASFRCSNETLNKVWEFCRYTIRATTLFGCYIDGERERLPYEGDSYLTALSHYCCDSDYTLAKHSIAYLLAHPTWPTEYFQIMPLIALDYFLYSGDRGSMEEWYPRLRRTLLLPFAFEGVLLDIRRAHEVYSDEEIMGITGLDRHLAHWFRDMIDWPHIERDGYDFGSITSNPEILADEHCGLGGIEFARPNFVPNAFHTAALRTMAAIASYLDRPSDAAFFTHRADAVRAALRKTMMNGDGKTPPFRDSPGSHHTAVMTDALALFAGIAEGEEIRAVAEDLSARKMACSVFGSTFVLGGLFRNGFAPDAVKLMATDSAPRSWSGMLRQGATITMETWDNYHAGQDWNHSWATAPLHIVSREMFGILPLEPGFTRFSITPRIAFLRHASCVQPTLHGPVGIQIVRKDGETAELTIEVPPGTEAELHLDGKTRLLAPGKHLVAGDIPLEG